MKETLIEQFLNSRIPYAWDFQIMIGDIKTCLEMSEDNLEMLHDREIEFIKNNSENRVYTYIPDGYQKHLQNNADFRFKVSQPLQIRYGALISLIISIEWAINYLDKKLINPINTKHNTKNITVHKLHELNNCLYLEAENTILDYEALVKIRNCIVHNSGIKKGFRFEDELLGIIERIEGMNLEQRNIFGDHIWIEKNSLIKYIDCMRDLVIQIFEKAYELKLVNKI